VFLVPRQPLFCQAGGLGCFYVNGPDGATLAVVAVVFDAVDVVIIVVLFPMLLELLWNLVLLCSYLGIVLM
jgi:hypothetical protein